MPGPGARIALILITIVVVVAGTADCQQAFNVVEVEVVGNRVASKSLILGVSSVAVGSPLSPLVTAET